MASTFRERQLPPSAVRRILRRAAEIAESDPETAAVERALTRDELERRAADLGLPASAVARALAAPEPPEPAGEGPWLAPRTVTLEQEISGELPSERHEQVVTAIRAVAGTQGRTEILGKTLTWSAVPAARPLVTMRSQGGRTSVCVEESLNGLAMLGAFAVISLFPGLMAGALVSDTTHSSKAALAVGACAMLCAWVASAFFASRIVRRREAFLHRLMQQVTSAVAFAVDRPAATAPEVPPSAAPTAARIASENAASPSATRAELEAAAEAESEAEAAVDEDAATAAAGS